MGRAKLNMELIAKEKSRHTTFLKRKKGLRKKIYEFTTLCEVDACMILYPPQQDDRPIEPEIWPNNLDEIHRIINRFHNIGMDERGKRSLDLYDFFDERQKKIEDELVKLRRRNDEFECFAWDHQINGFTVDQLQQLIDTLGSKIKLMDGRIQLMKGGKESILDGITDYSHTAQNQNPSCYNMPNTTFDGTTTPWGDDTVHLQSLRYVKPWDYHHMMSMDYPTDHPPMIFDNARMTPMNGFDCGNLSNGGTIGNFSYHPTVKQPFLNNHTVQSMGDRMEFANQGPSTYRLQPSFVQPITLYHPNLMHGGSSSSSHQMHPQLFDELLDFQDPLSKYKRARFN